jgi:hypothetical protein
VRSRRYNEYVIRKIDENSDSILDRMVNAVELVRRRLIRASESLSRAGIEYAVVGGNAVAAWVATVDDGAVRNTQDVDILIRRADFDRAKAALEAAGFVYRRAAGLDAFLDGPSASPRQGVHLVFANEVVKPGEPAADPGVEESTDLGPIRVATLEALLRIKLTAYRRKDQVHVLDMIEVGLLDATWIGRLPPVLGERLRVLLETPGG